MGETVVGEETGRSRETVLRSGPLPPQSARCNPRPATIRKVLIVAPMSGHFATLLRGTVEAMLPEHEVYITDWIDARNVPLSEGQLRSRRTTPTTSVEFCQVLAEDGGERPAVMAVCQPGVPVLVAGSVMAEAKDPARPSSMVADGQPDRHADQPDRAQLGWHRVAPDQLVREERHRDGALAEPGLHARVYPGFLQLSGFMSDEHGPAHVDAHFEHFKHLVRRRRRLGRRASLRSMMNISR